MVKAILLLSGGLDSTLAGKLLLDIGIGVEAVNFVSPFCQCTPKSLGCPAGKRAAEQLGIPLQVFACGPEYLEVVKHPRFGRGRGMNPCIDCRIHMFSRAREHMERRGADFVATGEVLGERPMSQRRAAMKIIELESGLSDLIVRPLCAQLFPPSLPERQGLVDRRGLRTIQGRSRRPQFSLARELGVKDYLCPAGGCLLTEREYAARMRELLEHDPDFGIADARLLRLGRHFRLPSGTKVVVGRNQQDNDALERAVQDRDVLLVPQKVPGPSVVCRGVSAETDIPRAAGLLSAYVKGGLPVDVEINHGRKGEWVWGIPGVRPLSRETVVNWRVGLEPGT